jgi:hypothetical protein
MQCIYLSLEGLQSTQSFLSLERYSFNRMFLFAGIRCTLLSEISSD